MRMSSQEVTLWLKRSKSLTVTASGPFVRADSAASADHDAGTVANTLP